MSDQYSLIDHCILQLDSALRTLFVDLPEASRRSPALTTEDSPLSPAEKRISIGMMRVNHAGEVCAQALYQGQAITAEGSAVRAAMQTAASEEQDHLAWCMDRLEALGSTSSVLNPLWTMGSFCIGAMSGWMGDGWSLGFVAETEKQVVEHLRGHLQEMPVNDAKSRAVISQMIIDEDHHRTQALQAGAFELPFPVQLTMRYTAKVMTGVAYYV